MKKIFVILLAVLLTGAISAKALEYFRGTSEEIAQVQNDVLGYEAINGNKVNTGGYFRENLLPLVNNTYDVGSSALKFKNGFFAGTLTTGGAFTSGGNLLPDGNNTRDLGAYSTAWRDIYASGTIYGGTSGLSLAGHILPSSDNTYDIGSQILRWNEINGFSASTTLLSVFSTVYIGGTVTSTLVTGNRGAATSTFYSDLSVVNRDVVIGGAANSGWLWVGDGTATTSIRGGTAGSVSSTLEGDTVIANLFSGTNIFDTDAGMVDAMDLPVSASAATGTLEGYNFPVDSKPLMSLVSQSDALGSVWAGYAGISTQSPSSSLHVANDFMGINNTGGTSTVTIGSDRMSPGCLVFQNSSRSGWIGCWLKSGDTTLTCAAITNVPNCQ